MKANFKVAFDVDGTLFDYLDKPRTEVIQLLQAFVALGCSVYMWSGGGPEYARNKTNSLHLPESVRILVKGSMKVDLAVDDQYVSLGVANLRTNPLGDNDESN